MTRWSHRTSWTREPTALAKLLESARDGELTDLSESNPTRCGFDDPARLAALCQPAGARYVADPFGMAATRAAVARYYARRDQRVDPENVVLTASTSEAYGWLFKLLCNPGDAILGPRPSYPLFPYLADLESVRLVHYPLLRRQRWRVDLAALRAQLDATAQVRALLLVHPANPTGSSVGQEEASALAALARERDLAIIVDEVFADYRQSGERAGVGSFVGFGQQHGVRCFTLSGMSKVALLPQLKLSWLVVSGVDDDRTEALGRLELIADSYLSVSTAAQLAATALLDDVDEIQQRLRRRLRANTAALDAAIAAQGDDCPVRRLPRDGGWYALVEVPRTRSDDQWVERLVEREGIVVHPGYFFDMTETGTMVISLLPDSERFVPAIGRAVTCWARG